MGFTFADDQAVVHHRLQVPLQRPAVDIGTQALEILDGQAAVLQDVSEGHGLAVRKAVFLDENIPADGSLPTVFDLGKLCAQTFNKILQPTGHIHAYFTHALDRPVECGAIPL